MTNLVITTTPNAVHVLFNDYTALAGASELSLRADCIGAVGLDSEGLVQVQLVGLASRTGMGLSAGTMSGAMQVDTVNGVTPADNAALKAALVALMG